MGKSGEEDHPLPSTVAAEDPWRNAVAAGCASVVRVKCVIVLLFSLAVFLSVLLWLPPFVHFPDPKDLYLNSNYRVRIFFWETLTIRILKLLC
ncbi:hypothetical protein LR48_Vigan02g045000 [Vigna angularis]|uniref:Uncharacterized protein n=1 Tax=Phaseolus angularis TaxID=3914 RepID=A0A0L9TUR3_PHAAN|nr:hypothetical protein LR48_Vigan02g045000 [Vigna angularis]